MSDNLPQYAILGIVSIVVIIILAINKFFPGKQKVVDLNKDIQDPKVADTYITEEEEGNIMRKLFEFDGGSNKKKYKNLKNIINNFSRN